VNNHDPKTLWSEVLETLRPEIGEGNCDLWMRDIEPLEIANQNFVIRVPNKFFTKQIKEHYQLRIESLLKTLSGQDFALEYSEKNDIESLLPKEDPIPVAKPHSEFSLSELNPKYTFATFVVGPSNRHAHAIAEAIAKSPGRLYNPVFLYGGVGLGKTHLMQAIGHGVRKQHPHARVLYITSEQFVNEYIDSIRNEKPDSFRNKYRNLDCLLIDDIQFLIGKQRSEEEFFYTFNSLFESHKQIVIASDRPPKDMAPAEQRIITRLTWGAVTDIKAPDLETRIAILRKKAEAEQIVVPDDVVLFVATTIKSNIRQLEGALISMKAVSALSGTQLTVDAAKDLLKGSIGIEESSTVRVDTIQREVAAKYSLDLKEMKSRSRRSEVAFPRQLAMYLSSVLTELSTTDIGRAFGGRDHTTVIHARDKIKRMLETDPFFLENINKLIERIRSVDNL